MNLLDESTLQKILNIITVCNFFEKDLDLANVSVIVYGAPITYKTVYPGADLKGAHWSNCGIIFILPVCLIWCRSIPPHFYVKKSSLITHPRKNNLSQSAIDNIVILNIGIGNDLEFCHRCILGFTHLVILRKVCLWLANVTLCGFKRISPIFYNLGTIFSSPDFKMSAEMFNFSKIAPVGSYSQHKLKKLFPQHTTLLSSLLSWLIN